MVGRGVEVLMLGGGGHATAVAASLAAPVDGYVGPEQQITDADLLQRDPAKLMLVNGVGFQGEAGSLREALYVRFQNAGFRFVGVRHPQAAIDPTAVVASDAQILIGATLVAGSSIGANAIINSGAIVDHNTRVGDHSHIAPGAVLCGDVVVGVGAFVGAGAVVLPGVGIGDRSVVGAGAVVRGDVAPGARVAGVPAKELQRRTMTNNAEPRGPEMQIGDRFVGAGHPCFIIAEAGVNHDGSVDKALELVQAAADAGADAIKFQTFDPDALTTRDAPAAQYQTDTIGATDQHSMLKKLTLPAETWSTLAKAAADLGLLFMSTPFDIESMQSLVDDGMPAIKISSGDITNHILLRKAAGCGVPVILSTGASTYDEVEAALKVLEGAPAVALLHCVTAYPSPLEESNLAAIPTMAARFGRIAGWSDHTVGSESALMAIAIGAQIIEKHLTLDSEAAGPDHRASADPRTMGSYVAAIRRAERALGNGDKKPTKAEADNRMLVRRSLFAAKDLAAGSILASSDLTSLRPGTGMSADTAYIGKHLARPLAAGDALRVGDLSGSEQ